MDTPIRHADDRETAVHDRLRRIHDGDVAPHFQYGWRERVRHGVGGLGGAVAGVAVVSGHFFAGRCAGNEIFDVYDLDYDTAVDRGLYEVYGGVFCEDTWTFDFSVMR